MAMTMQVEDVRSRLLSRELELQLLVGHVVESVFLARAGQPLNDSDRSSLQLCAARLREGANELSGDVRTLAQSAEAADVLSAAQRVLGSSDAQLLRTELSRLAGDLTAIGETMSEPSEQLAATLLRLHDALSDATSGSTEVVDEVHARACRHD
jgi:hypothetical protein